MLFGKLVTKFLEKYFKNVLYFCCKCSDKCNLLYSYVVNAIIIELIKSVLPY